MATYDPKRTRVAPSAEPAGAAPVDALLGGVTPSAAEAPPPEVPPADVVRLAPSQAIPSVPAPEGPGMRIAVVAGVAAAAAIAYLLVRRRRG